MLFIAHHVRIIPSGKISNTLSNTSIDVITGDMNVDLSFERKHVLVDILNGYNLVNVITEPTRVNVTTGNPTLLDQVLISGDCNCPFSEVIDINRDISDHNAAKVYIKIPNYVQQSYQRTIRLKKSADFDKFNS